jgi:hypothetical protein
VRVTDQFALSYPKGRGTRARRCHQATRPPQPPAEHRAPHERLNVRLLLRPHRAMENEVLAALARRTDPTSQRRRRRSGGNVDGVCTDMGSPARSALPSVSCSLPDRLRRTNRGMVGCRERLRDCRLMRSVQVFPRMRMQELVTLLDSVGERAGSGMVRDCRSTT